MRGRSEAIADIFKAHQQMLFETVSRLCPYWHLEFLSTDGYIIVIFFTFLTGKENPVSGFLVHV